LPELVKQGIVPVSEVDLACRRILNAKYRLGLFSDPYRGLNDAAPARVHLSNEHRAIAYQAAVESWVLFANNNNRFAPIAQCQHRLDRPIHQRQTQPHWKLEWCR
ncbi:MAG: hypothetical protein ACK4XI_08345, partial [Bacteroidota bacterium]